MLVETDCSSPHNCDWHVVTYTYEVQCFDCHSEGDIMCMQAVRIILYWTLNYCPFASFDHALETQGLLYSIINSMKLLNSQLSVLFLDL